MWWVRIRDTQKNGAMCCILGRSKYQPQIYSVCVVIWWQITFFKNKFGTIYEQQGKDTRQTSIFTKFEGCSCASKPSVAFLTFHTFACKLAGKIIDKWMENYKGTELFLAQVHPSNLVNIFVLPSILILLFINRPYPWWRNTPRKGIW